MKIDFYRLFEAWLASHQGLSVSNAGIYTQETLDLLASVEIPKGGQELFESVLRGVIVSNFSHAPTKSTQGGPICTPEQAVDYTLDVVEAMVSSWVLLGSKMTSDELAAATAETTTPPTEPPADETSGIGTIIENS